MRFSNPLISLVAAIALASSVIASTIPERRGGSPPTQSCSTGSSTCCTDVSPFTSLSSATQGGLLTLLGLNTIANIPVGLNCVLPVTMMHSAAKAPSPRLFKLQRVSHKESKESASWNVVFGVTGRG
ncbi:hypothetical protein V8E53_001009 [Lactarius tabidus]